jgi:O-antigen ligase
VNAKALRSTGRLLPLGAAVLAILAGKGVAGSSLSWSHPLVQGIGALVLVVAFLRPHAGVMLLLITLWLQPIFPTAEGITLNRVAGLAVLGGVIARKAVRLDREPLVLGRFDYFFFAFLATALASTVFNRRALDFSEGFRGMVMGYLFYFLIVNAIDSWQKLRAVGWLLVACAVFITVGSIAEVLMVPAELRKSRIGGYFQNTGAAAQFSFAAIILLIWLSGGMQARKKPLRLALYMLIPGFCVTILISGSRSTFLDLLAATLSLTLLSRKAESKPKYVVGILVALVVGASLIYPFVPGSVRRIPSVLPGFDRFVGLSEYEKAARSTSYATRVSLSQAAWNMFMDHPFLGVGFGHFSPLSRSYGPRLERDLSGHNLFLTTLAEIGFVGGVWLMLLYGEVIVGLWRARERAISAGPEKARAVNGMLSLLIGMNIVEALFHGSYIDRPKFVVFALSTVTSRLVESYVRLRHDRLSPP